MTWNRISTENFTLNYGLRQMDRLYSPLSSLRGKACHVNQGARGEKRMASNGNLLRWVPNFAIVLCRQYSLVCKGKIIPNASHYVGAKGV